MHLSLTVLEAEKSKIKLPANSVSGEILFPISSPSGRHEGALRSLFYQGTIPLMRAPPSWPKHLQRLHLQIPLHWGFSFDV